MTMKQTLQWLLWFKVLEKSVTRIPLSEIKNAVITQQHCIDMAKKKKKQQQQNKIEQKKTPQHVANITRLATSIAC